ncbi:MAG: hydrogenase maturation protease [Myxococcaceae bacterium]
MTAPVLVFGYGNPSRGDDALGPEFVRRLELRCADAIARGELEVLTDYQLQVEHALDLRDRRAVYFVDASARGEPVEVRPVTARQDPSFTTHLLSPAALLHTWTTIEHTAPPPAWTVAIRGQQFALGAPMSAEAERNLTTALDQLSLSLQSGERAGVRGGTSTNQW